MANKKLSAVITIGGAVASTLIGSIDKTKSKLGEVGSALKNLESQQRKLGQAIQTFGQQGKNVDGMRTRYQALTREIEKQKLAQEKLLRVEKMRQQQSEQMGRLGKTAAIGAAIAAPAGLAINKSAGFNYDLQAIGNTANMDRDAVKKMGNDILVASEKVGQSSENLKNAVGFLVASGDTAGSAMAKIETIGKTATAADAAIEDVAKTSFTLQDALKIDANNMGRALEMLVQAGKEGNFEFKGMAQELPVLGASFQALKFTGTEAVASMGAYLQIARKGAATSSEAANNMNNFLAKILSPETLKKAEKMGSDLYGVISGTQARGENPIEAAMAEINRITKGGDQKLLGELFGDMQVQNFVRPVLQNLKEYDEYKKNILNSKDVVKTDFAVMMETSKKQTEQLTNSFANLTVVIGTTLEPAMGKLTAAFTPLVIAGREFIQNNPELVTGITLAAGALVGATAAITTARIAWTLLNTTMTGQAIVSSLATVTASLARVAGGIRLIGAAFMSTGVGALIAGIGLAALQIYQHWDGIAAFFRGTFEGISTDLQPVVQTFKNFYDSLGVLKPVVDAIGSGLSTVWRWFTSLLQPVQYSSEELTKAGAAGKSFGEALAYGINLVLAPLQLLIQGITWVNNNIGAALAQVNQFGSAVGGKAFDAVQKVKGWFGSEEPAAPAAVPTGPAASVPSLPAMATARAGGPTVTDSSQNTFNIYQQPGQDQKKLAEEIARQQEQRRKVQQRGALYDGAMAQ